jgi:integrase
VEVAGSNPASSTQTPTSYTSKPPSQIVQIIWQLKTQGYADETLFGISKRLEMLELKTDITNPGTVKTFIARQDNWGKAYKESVVNAYNHYVNFNGLKWDKPNYSRDERIPNVPTTEQANLIIGASGKKYSLMFSILRDTGLRPVELTRIPLKNIDLEQGIIHPQTAKNGSGRVLKLTQPTLAMLKNYIAKNDFDINDKIFPSTRTMSHVWVRIRNRLAKKLQQPELTKYRLYDLRHYFATMLYAKTKDILLVKQQLGHKRIEHTLIYTHLINFKTDEYISRTVQLGTPTTLKEICELAESGFTKFTEIDEYQIFKKPK